MKRNLIVKSVSLLLLLVLTTACSQANETATLEPAATVPSSNTEIPSVTEPPAATEPSPATATPESIIASPVSEQCANTYYPVRDGATWTYSSTGGPAGGYGFTDTITSVSEEGFTLTSQFGDLTRTQEWACRPEGLVALQLGGTSAAVLNNDDMQLTLTADNVNGVTFPRDMKPGDTWQHSLAFAGKITVAGQQMDAQGDALSKFRADGYESVTVPAGTFDALRIHVDTTININGSVGGVSFPVTVTTPYDYWFAKDVGWVKASGTGNVSGQSFGETIELQSYNIP